MLKIDFNSAEWLSIVEWAQARVDDDMRVLKNRKADHEPTQFARGRISALEELLSIPSSQTVLMEEVNVNY